MNKNLMIAGLDIGNGYVKGLTQTGNGQPEGIDFPSGVVRMATSHDIKTSGSAINDVIEDIFNEMDATFDSPLVKSAARTLFGQRALRSGITVVEFDVSITSAKATDSLSPTLVLGCLAGRALQDYWRAHHELPTDMLNIKAKLALALPISEYKRYRAPYADGYKTGTHLVCIHNFEQPVRVSIDIEDVYVLAEGASAQYAIMEKGLPLMNAMLADVRAMGEPLDGITAEDILEAKNTMGIDIGEGTVNFPVYQGGRFNPDSSMTFTKGYGHVLNRAMDALREAQYPFNSRKALADFLQEGPTGIKRARYARVREFVDAEISNFCDEVNQAFSQLMARVGSYIDVIYVYGGGASDMKTWLHPKLIETAKKLGGADVEVPILYLDSRYSRKLNREGLFLVVKQLAEQEAATAAPEAETAENA